MSDRRKSQLPDDFAEIVENFKHQSSSSRPRIGINSHNFMSYGASSSTMEAADGSITRKTLFDSSAMTNTSYSIPTDLLLRSTSKRKSTFDLEDFGTPKKMPLTPGGLFLVCIFLYLELIEGLIFQVTLIGPPPVESREANCLRRWI